MNRFVKIGLLMALALALVGSYRFVVVAQEGPSSPMSPPPSSAPGAQAPEVLGTNHVLSRTYINSCIPAGTCGLIVPAKTYTAVDAPTTINCAAPIGKTCTLQADQYLTRGSNASAANLDGLCLVVDGVQSPTCYYSGEATTDYSSTALSVSQGPPPLSRGNHTVQTQVYSIDGESVFLYTMTYRLYVP